MFDKPMYRPNYVEGINSPVTNEDLAKIVNSPYAGLCSHDQRKDCGVKFTCSIDQSAHCKNCLVSKHNLKLTKNMLKKLTIELLRNS